MSNSRNLQRDTNLKSVNINYNESDLIDARTYLPDFLLESGLVVSIVDCLNSLISKDRPIFEQIYQAHNDMLYRTRDYSKLSYEAKIEIVRELGFSYLLDILTLSSDQLSKLLIFFNLIYALKGKKEGLDICLKTLGMNYTYKSWYEMEPKGQPFTATLKIVGNEYAASQVFTKIKTFIRSYMLPWIEITIELTIEAPPTFVYPSAGILTRYKSGKIFGATRDVVGIAIYDNEPAYDVQYYGAEINTAPDQFIPYEMPKSVLSINVVPESATVIIDGEETNVKEVEQGKPIHFSISAEGYKGYGNHIVLTHDKNLNIKLQKF